MKPRDPHLTAVADAPPTSTVRPAAPAAVARLELLDGGEVIEFSIRPSLWMIPLVSWRIVVASVALAVTVVVASGGVLTGVGLVGFQVLAATAIVRVAVASLQWASKLYVLTDRRVLRFRGFFEVEVSQCLLTRVSRVDLVVSRLQSGLGVGSIVIESNGDMPQRIVWQHVANAPDVLERLRRAVVRAQARR